MRQYLVTQKGVVIIDISRISRDISHREIETQMESSFRGRNPMEASTLGYREFKIIIAVVAATM